MTEGIRRKQKNALLSFIKGCGCIGVVCIHVVFPGIVGEIIKKAAQYAVPIFFMISGYYAYGEDNDVENRIKRRCFRIFKITLYALLLYVLYSYSIHIIRGDLAIWTKSFLNLKAWIRIVVLCDFEYWGAGHLWFLAAQVYGYLFLLFISKKQIYDIAYKALPFIFILRILVTITVASWGRSWHITSNFFMSALPWMLLGNCFAYHEKIKDKLSNMMLVGTFAVSGLWAVLAMALYTCGYLSVEVSELGIVFYSITLFLLALKNPTVSINRFIEKLGDEYSLYVYIIHVLIYAILIQIVQYYDLGDSLLYIWGKPVFVAVCAIICSIGLHSMVMRRLSLKKAA